MADRVTQLQDLVMLQAENIWAGISFTEKCSTPYVFTDMKRRKPKLSKKEKLQLRLAGETNKPVEKEEPVEEEPKVEVPSIDYPSYFSKKIAEVAIDINTLIDSLPDDTMLSPDLQVESLKKLEECNMELSKKLEDLVLKGELLLEQIRISSEFLSCEYLKTFFPK